MRILTGLIVTSLLLCLGCKPKHFTATTTLQIHPPTSVPIRPEDPTHLSASQDWIDDQISVLQSVSIILSVERRLEEPLRSRFTNPYKEELQPMPPASILSQHRTIEADKIRNTLSVHYSHPDPEIAAIIANRFAEEYLNYDKTLNSDASMANPVNLNLRAIQLKENIETLESKRSDLLETNAGVKEHDTILLKVQDERSTLELLEKHVKEREIRERNKLERAPYIIEHADVDSIIPN